MIHSGKAAFKKTEGIKLRVRLEMYVPPSASELVVFNGNVDIRAVGSG